MEVTNKLKPKELLSEAEQECREKLITLLSSYQKALCLPHRSRSYPTLILGSQKRYLERTFERVKNDMIVFINSIPDTQHRNKLESQTRFCTVVLDTALFDLYEDKPTWFQKSEEFLECVCTLFIYLFIKAAF